MNYERHKNFSGNETYSEEEKTRMLMGPSVPAPQLPPVLIRLSELAFSLHNELISTNGRLQSLSYMLGRPPEAVDEKSMPNPDTLLDALQFASRQLQHINRTLDDMGV